MVPSPAAPPANESATQSFGPWMEGCHEPADVEDSVRLFAVWAAGKWDMLHRLFKDKEASYVPLHKDKVTLSDFKHLLQYQGFEGNAVRVFWEIQRRGGHQATINNHSGLHEEGIDPDAGITVAQMINFERRCQSMLPKGGVEGSPISRLVKLLREKRGCVLRGWRLDLDVRLAGCVTHSDFVNACRKLNIPTEARHIWTSLRPDSKDKSSSKPLVLSELDTEEADNVNEFAQAIWVNFGLDLDKAWAVIDPCGRTVVSVEEFVYAVKSFGFGGSAKLLFRGLDSSGLGRLMRADFEYMNVFIRASSKLNYSASSIRDLSSWVETQGGLDVFLDKLGFEAEVKAGRSTNVEAVGLTVSDLAARLTALGYPGDALSVAAVAARHCQPPRKSHVGDKSGSVGGGLIVRSKMHDLLGARRSGAPPRRESLAVRVIQLNEASVEKSAQNAGAPEDSKSLEAAAAQKAKTPTWRPRKVWENSVANIASENDTKPPCARSYFSVPPKTMGLHVLDGTGDHLQPETARDGPKSPSSSSASPKVDTNRSRAVSNMSTLSTSSSAKRLDMTETGFAASGHGRRSRFVWGKDRSSLKALVMARPAWDNHAENFSEVNCRRPGAARQYFSNAEHPVKDEIQKEHSQRRAAMRNKRSASAPKLASALRIGRVPAEPEASPDCGESY